LAKKFRNAFKECGIKGVLVKSETYSGGQSFYFTIKTTVKDFLPFEVYLNKRIESGEPLKGMYSQLQRGGRWISARDLNGLTNEEYKSLVRENLERHYKSYTEGTTCEFSGFCEDMDMATDDLKERLNAITKVVKSFNYDDSDGMTDYFHRRFYEHYRFKNA
jgi:hypothetical protein